MSDTPVKLAGIFHGIKFAVKEKEKTLVQTAGLNFEVELDETGLDQMRNVIGWQRQPVFLSIARRQASLFDEEAQPQGKLPLEDPNASPPVPAGVSLSPCVPEMDSAGPPTGTYTAKFPPDSAIDTEFTWREFEVGARTTCCTPS